MKHIITLLIIVAILLCGCSAPSTETTPTSEPSATEPSTAPVVDTAKPLTEMTDYELILEMAKKEHCRRWTECSYLGAYPFTVLMYFSPEFSELMTRSTAVASLRLHLGTVNALYPHSDLNALKPFIPDIQAFLDDAATSRADLTDYELLRTMAEKGVCTDWLNCKNTNDLPYTVITIHSPEFAELMTRTTAADSIQTYAAQLDEEYPDGNISCLLPYIQEFDSITGNIDASLSKMTDYELILAMAKKEHCCRWSESSYLGAYPFTVLMYFSPEFTELISRPTAADSLGLYIDSVDALYPHSDMDALKPFIPDIQAFLDDAATPRTDVTDYELLRTMAEKGVCYDWQSCKNTNNYPYTVIMIHSPEFAELMTRSTAANSIRTYVDPLMEQYPNSALDALTYYISDIEGYIKDHQTK